MPLWANYQTAPLNLFNVIFEIFPSLKLLDYLLMLKLVLLGIFSYLFATELGLSAISSALSAFVICFCGFLCQNINHINLNVDLWLPASLLLSEKIFKSKPNWSRLLTLGLLISFALFGGNPQAAFYFLLFVMLYAVIRGGWTRKKEILVIFLGISLGMVLSLVQYLSFLEYVGFSWNYHHRGIYSLDIFRFNDLYPVRRFYSVFFPWLFGPAQTWWDLASLPGYIGLIPVFLALITLSRVKRLSRSVLFFLIYALILWALIYDLPPVSWLSRLPVLDQIRTTRHAYFSACFCLAILSGFGLDYFLKKSISWRNYAGALILSYLLVILSLALAFVFPLKPVLENMDHKAWIIPLILLIATQLFIALGIFLKRRRIFAMMIAVFALVNLLWLGSDLKPIGEFLPAEYQYKHPSVPAIYSPMLQEKSRYRLVGVSIAMIPNFNVLFGINDFRASEGIYPRSYIQAVAEIKGFQLEEFTEVYIRQGFGFTLEPEDLEHQWLDRLGVKYIISANILNITDLVLIGSAEGYYFYENPKAWNRAWVKRSSGQIDFEGASIHRYLPDQVLIKVSPAEDSELVLADQYAPGWRAFSLPNKTERKISPEAILLRKVPIQPGDDYIIFIYQPWGFRIGLFFSLVSICALVSALIFQQILRLFSRRLAIRA